MLLAVIPVGYILGLAYVALKLFFVAGRRTFWLLHASWREHDACWDHNSRQRKNRSV